MRRPSEEWQARGEAVATAAERTLWTAGGGSALLYLRRRGFSDEAIRGARLGFIAGDRREPAATWGLPADRCDVWIPAGISIPWRACGSLWRLNVRRPRGTPRYIGPAGGSGTGLYGVDGVRLAGRPVVLVEGELDALAVLQVAGDLVAAVATGSTCGARRARWVQRLSCAPFVLVAYDDDDAGDAAAAWWLQRLPRARRLVPDTDPAAMLEAGADLRTWIREGGPRRWWSAREIDSRRART